MTYFEKEDILHLKISDDTERGSIELGPNITAELNENGDLIGIEILNASVIDEMQDEYSLNYDKAKPNRFAGKLGQDRLMVCLDEDVAAVFKTAESVNQVLRAIITSLPTTEKGSN